MKKITAITVILIMILSIIPLTVNSTGLLLYYDGGVLEYTGDFYTIFVQGTPLACDVPPVVIDNRTLVPIRALTEKLGATVEYYQATQTAVIRLNGFVFQFQLNTRNVTVNGTAVVLDVPAKVFNNRTMVPLRFIAEYMNMDVGWFQSNLTITVDYTRLSSVTFSEGSSTYDINISVPKYNNNSDFTLSNPDRVVVDLPNVLLGTDASSLTIDKGAVSRVRWSQYTPTNVRVVIDLNSAKNYTVIKDSGRLIIRFTKDTVVPTPSPTIAPVTPAPTAAPNAQTVDQNITYLKLTGKSIITFNDFSPSIPDGGSFSDVYTEQKSPDGMTCIYFINGRLFSNDTNVYTPILDDILDNMASTYVTLTNKTRIEFNAKRTCDYKIEYDSIMKKMTITVTTDFNTGVEPDTTVPSTITNSSFSYNTNTGNEEIFISVPGYDSYYSYRIDSRTIVLDVVRSYAQSGYVSIPVSGKYITQVRYSQVDTQVVKVIVYLNADISESIISRSGGIAIQVYDPQLYRASYYNLGDRHAVMLKWTKLTDFVSPDFLRYYTDTYSPDGLTYTIKYETGNGDVGAGRISVGDGMIDYIDIRQTGVFTEVVIHSVKRFRFNVYTRYTLSDEAIDTAITVLDPAQPGDRLVVIDAGHGGDDPGAVNGTDYESNFNLDLAKKVNKILRANGIKTYMIRSEDAIVSLRERVYIANQLNNSLYFCIHNNSAGSIASGTETLYYSRDAKGPTIAAFIQNQIIGSLGTYNRGIKPADDLFVLNSTDSIAVLVELLFMNNPAELTLLQSDSFRQLAAEAMVRGILQSLSEI